MFNCVCDYATIYCYYSFCSFKMMQSHLGGLDVKFQLAQDTLETMLSSMYSIRDQLSNMVSRCVQTWPRPAGLTNLLDLHPISGRTDAPVSRFQVSVPRPDTGGSSGGFSSPKPEPPYSTNVIYKSSEIKLKSEEIQRILNHIWWDLAGSDQIPADFSDFGADFSNFDAGLVSFYIFRRWFADFGAFFCRYRWHLRLRRRLETDRPDPISTRTQNWLDRLTPAIGFGSLFFPLDAGRSSSGWV